MAEMTIRLRVNPETGKQDIIIALRSDDDALPHEHENHHQQLVDQLIEGGVLQAGEAGNVIVEREEQGQVQAPRQSSTPQSEGLSESG